MSPLVHLNNFVPSHQRSYGRLISQKKICATSMMMKGVPMRICAAAEERRARASCLAVLSKVLAPRQRWRHGGASSTGAAENWGGGGCYRVRHHLGAGASASGKRGTRNRSSTRCAVNLTAKRAKGRSGGAESRSQQIVHPHLENFFSAGPTASPATFGEAGGRTTRWTVSRPSTGA